MIPSNPTSAAGSSLGAVVNQAPLPGKLTILPIVRFSAIPVPVPLPPYVAMFNPEQWEIQEGVRYQTAQPAGSDGTPTPTYANTERRKLSFDLLIDGTGASGEKREVLADILYLKKVVGYNGDIHRPNRLIVIWGTQLFQGVLENMGVKITLFRPNGTPLRATVSLSIIEDIDRTTGQLTSDLRSSDLTHLYRVRVNDRLDLLCHQVYDDSRFYMEVARANRLTTFRAPLPVGKELVFPPTEK